MLKKLAGGAGALLVGLCAQAAPITITQTYHDVAYDDYGVSTGIGYGKSPTGDWIFTATVDSNAADLSTETSYGIHGYDLSRLTLTQGSLGLHDAVITNAPVLMFFPDRFAFAATVDGAPPWSVVVYEHAHFAGASSLAEELALVPDTPAVADPYTSFGPQWGGFLFNDGSRLFGWGFGSATVAVSTVPEPENIALMAASLAILAMASRHLRSKRIEPRAGLAS